MGGGWKWFDFGRENANARGGRRQRGLPETISASSHQILCNSSIFRRARTYLEEINGHIVIAGKQLLLDEREAFHSGSHGDQQTAQLEGQSTSGFGPPSRRRRPGGGPESEFELQTARDRSHI